MDAVEKLKAGVTTLEEVTRVTAEDDLEVLKAMKQIKQEQAGEGHSA